jgi:hypothetical protein
METSSNRSDQPTARIPIRPAPHWCKDLKQRGLLKDTIVIWGGEFGRTPMVQGGDDGRDHHPNAFTMWMAGGGIKPGITLGQTDDLGFNVTEDRVHVHDLHATLLHLLGFDHEKLTYRFQGRDFRLTDVCGPRRRQAARLSRPDALIKQAMRGAPASESSPHLRLNHRLAPRTVRPASRTAQVGLSLSDSQKSRPCIISSVVFSPQ